MEFLTLDMVNEYLRVDDVDEENNIIKLLIKNAQFYIEDASRPYEKMSDRTKEKAKLLGLVLISDWYDNRSYNMKTSEKARFTVQSLLSQIKYCDDYWGD